MSLKVVYKNLFNENLPKELVFDTFDTFQIYGSPEKLL